MGYHWSLVGVLRLIYSLPALVDIMSNPEQPKLIVRGDGAKIGGKQCLLFAVTLQNFGDLCNRTRFQFIIGAGRTTDKQQSNLALLLGKGLEITNSNFDFIQAAIKTCKYCAFIHSFSGRVDVDDAVYVIEVKFSGDESYFRVLLGLEGSKSIYFCWKCCDVRDAQPVGNFRKPCSADIGVPFLLLCPPTLLGPLLLYCPLSAFTSSTLFQCLLSLLLSFPFLNG